MPVLDIHPPYKPGLIFRQRHINTMFPYLSRKDAPLVYDRERFYTSDDDFLDIDWSKNGSDQLVVLCHGLEGSSDSQYMRHTAQLLSDHQFDVLAMNYRSCSGELNKQPTMYHSGFTHDLHELLVHHGPHYKDIHLVGFSLGGNMVLKYTTDGYYKLPTHIRSVVSVSAPIDLAGSSRKITQWYNYAYEVRFLQTLRIKMKQKHEQFPDIVTAKDLEKVNSLVSFDEYFTGPLHGFTGADDYYRQCSSLQFLEGVHLPTLLIQAQDDPFLSPECFPYEIAKRSEHLHFKAPKFGGHLGFTTFGQSNYWNELEILNFINR